MEERGVGGGKTGQQGVGKKQGVAVAYLQKFFVCGRDFERMVHASCREADEPLLGESGGAR